MRSPVDAGARARERSRDTVVEDVLDRTVPLVALEDVTPEDGRRVGGKVLPLARLAADGLPVPGAVIVPVEAFEAALDEAGLLPLARTVAREGESAAAEALRAGLEGLRVPAALAGALRRAVERLGGVVAVRSSGIDEDGRTRSFAGQHRTVLGVGPTEVAEAVRQCWASLYSPRALAYRGGRGPAPGALAVLVQRLVDPRVSGVLFTINPMTGSWREMTVEAVWGLAEGLVAGQVTPHWYLVRRPRRTPRPVQRLLARVRLQRVQEDLPALESRWVRRADGTVGVEPVPDGLQRVPTLPPSALRRVCRLGLRVEAHLGTPQDVEWALDQAGRLWLLQSRPVTAGQAPRARDDVLWTRRFLGERFPEPVTPLAWSLIRPLLEHFIAYPEVQARYLAGGPALRLVGGYAYLNASVFPHLAFKLPGRPPPRFMLELLPADEADAFRRRFAVLPDTSVYGAILRTTFRERRWRRFAWNPFTNPDAWTRFEVELLEALPLLSRTPGGSSDAVRLVEDQQELLRRYVGIHVCSLLFANLWDQVLEGLLALWLPEEAVALREALATTPPGNRTLEVNRALVALARTASDQDLSRLEAGEAPEEPFGTALARFLEAYGHRSHASWDVFAPRWRQEPARLVPLLRARAEGEDLDARARQQDRAFRAARARVAGAVQDPGRRRALLGAVDLLRRYLLLRENQRFRFEQLQWVHQRTLLWLGAHLTDRGVLSAPESVRFLTWDEVLGLLDGAVDADRVPGWVTRRRTSWEAAFRDHPRPFLRGDEAHPVADGTTRLQGLGISPGRATGPVRRVRSLADADALQPGEILVAPAVDPGWTPLFLTAAGVVLELGGRLSHGAVVAREYGVPGVCNVDGALQRLRDGQSITVDGTRGVVFLHD